MGNLNDFFRNLAGENPSNANVGVNSQMTPVSQGHFIPENNQNISQTRPAVGFDHGFQVLA